VTRTHRLILRAFAVWTVYVWGTRIWNTVGDETHSFAFKAVHVTLALVSVAFAVAAWIVVNQIRRNQTAAVTAEEPASASRF
jgi:hypothetical protein